MPCERIKPSFLIIGAQKAGTSSLYNHICEHPNIVPAYRKEIHYFSLNYHRGIRWYLGFFPKKLKHINSICGEASPYYLFHPACAARIKADFPYIKLIVLLREPVSRAVSQYHHEVRLGYEKEKIAKAFSLEKQRLSGQSEKLKTSSKYRSFNHQHHSYASRSNYWEQLQEYALYFDESQILVVNSEEFFCDPKNTLVKVFSFLGVNDDVDLGVLSAINVGAYDKELPKISQSSLENKLSESNRKLYEKYGFRF